MQEIIFSNKRGAMLEFLSYNKKLQLRNPVLIISFSGWNDASSSATSTSDFIVDQIGGENFAEIEADPFYNFQQTRPLVYLNKLKEREISWPENTFYACLTPDLDHDLIILQGVEPNYHWRNFCDTILALIKDQSVSKVISIGSLIADVFHGDPISVSGSTTDPDFASFLGISKSRYEGPTGILGILNDKFKKKNIPAVSIWANIPHYVNFSPNPKAVLALMAKVSRILSLKFNTSELEKNVLEFEEKVDIAISKNKPVREYVDRLIESRNSLTDEELPSGENFVDEVEMFLRQKDQNNKKKDEK
tara:strand:- start:4957 stop:5871 length:915 start_codon:yes stop_codon:yes gene_type:complete